MPLLTFIRIWVKEVIFSGEQKKNKMEATDWSYQSDRPDRINPNRQLIGTKKVRIPEGRLSYKMAVI